MTHACFLCTPNQDWVYATSKNFFAMLGLGPIVEGYSLIGTKEHIPSMLDLTLEKAEELYTFSQTLRQLLQPHYGDIIITEHGRVPPCEFSSKTHHRTHCFHSHRLVFPIKVDIANSLAGLGLNVFEYPSFIECHKNFTGKGEYLYYERIDGSCLIASAPRDLVRQFFRYKVAEHVGHPEFASWTNYPRLEVIESARNRLLTSEAIL